MLRSWQLHVSTREMKVGWLDRGIWGSFSDLLGDLSALSSYEDALAEAVYEELDYLLTQKEGLGSPGECLCPPGISGCHHPLAVHIFSASADPMCAPGSQRQLLQRGRMASQSPVTSQPLSTLQNPGLSLLSLNTGPVGVGRVMLCVV